jgi:hypothetical protein
MSSSRTMAVMAVLSLGVILAPAGSVNAATQMYCAQVKGGATGPDCSFSSLNDCRTDVKAKGGGYCYKMQ